MVDIILENTDIGKIYESGQCFGISQNPYKTDEYWCVSGDRFCRVVYEGENKSVLTCFDGDGDYWWNYFDMNTDYEEIEKGYVLKDGTQLSKDITELCKGLRMLNQEFPDCLISFITSQRKSVPAIRTAVSNLYKTYGVCYRLEEYFGSEYKDFEIYTFPREVVYSHIDLEVLDDLGFGYRSLYIISAFNALSVNEINSEDLKKVGYLEAKNRLKSLYGVGEKIANCVLLYSLGYREAYPRDIWIERFEDEYCNGRFYEEEYGNRAGVIQLWHYYFMLNR